MSLMFKLQVPSTYHCIKKEGLIEEYISELSSHFKIPEDEIREDLKKILLSNNIEKFHLYKEDCTFLKVEADNYPEADKLIQKLRIDFDNLVFSYAIRTNNLKGLDKYSSLNCIPGSENIS